MEAVNFLTNAANSMPASIRWTIVAGLIAILVYQVGSLLVERLSSVGRKKGADDRYDFDLDFNCDFTVYPVTTAEKKKVKRSRPRKSTRRERGESPSPEVLAAAAAAAAADDERVQEAIREEKGRVGEARVANAVAFLGLPVLNDVYIPYGAGAGHTQIDHLVHLGNRIAVVETKNWDGVVEGALDSEHWWRGDDQFRNPVKQNAHHIAVLKRLVGKTWLQSVVVLVGSADPPPGTGSVVCRLEDLATVLRPGPSHPAVDAMWERLQDLEREQDKYAMGIAHKRRLQEKRDSGAIGFH